MLQKTKKAVAKKAYGKKLPKPMSYEFDFSEYENATELRAANNMLTDDEQVSVRNGERLIAARQKALKAMLDAAGIVPDTAETNAQIALRDMFKTLQTAKVPGTTERKYTDQQAREIAATTLGVDWEDDEDE